MANKRIKDLATSITTFRTGDVIAVDGPDGTAKMSKDTLLTLTSQNALAGNVAPAFDPTRTSENPYKAGESVVYEGKTYTFNVDHYGEWSADDVVSKNAVDVVKIIENSLTIHPNRYVALNAVDAEASSTAYDVVRMPIAPGMVLRMNVGAVGTRALIYDANEATCVSLSFETDVEKSYVVPAKAYLNRVPATLILPVSKSNRKSCFVEVNGVRVFSGENGSANIVSELIANGNLQNVYFKGKGSDFSFNDFWNKFVPGHKYRIYLLNSGYADTSEDTTLYKLLMRPLNSSNEPVSTNLIVVKIGETVADSYDFTMPSGSSGVRFGGRIASGVDVIAIVVDLSIPEYMNSTVIALVDNLKSIVSRQGTNIVQRSCYAVGANFYNEATTLHNSDINSSTGAITYSATLKVSDKIYLPDLGRPMHISNSNDTYLYCYDSSDAYLGRIEMNEYNRTVSYYFPTASYVRMESRESDTNIMLQFKNEKTETYVPYDPLGGLAKLLYLDNNFVKQSYMEGNFFDKNKIIKNVDIYSSGEEHYSETMFFTDYIKIDNTRPITIRGSHQASDASTTQYAYCYDANKDFISRVNCINGVTLSATTYIRVGGKIATDMNSIIISYHGYTEYKPLNPIIDYIKDYEKYYAEPSSRKITVLDFNVGDYSGTNLVVGSDETARAYRDIICESGADVVALQEDERYFDLNSVLPQDKVYLTMKEYYRYGTGQYNFKAILSDFPMLNKRHIEYTQVQEYPIRHTFFIASELQIGEISVTLIDVHLDWSDKYNRQDQINQIIDYCEDIQNVIVIGDMNPDDYIEGDKQSSGNTSEADSQLFLDAGYSRANGGLWGTFNTLASSTPGGPWDNCYVKGHLLLKNVYRIEKEWMADHYPVVIEMLVY